MNYTKGLVEQFKFLILLTTFTCLIPYIFCAGAYLIALVEQNKLKAGGWLKPVALGTLAFVFALWAIYGSGEQVVFLGMLMMLVAIPVYVWMQWKRKQDSKS